jgi:hypothetical protein
MLNDEERRQVLRSGVSAGHKPFLQVIRRMAIVGWADSNPVSPTLYRLLTCGNVLVILGTWGNGLRECGERPLLTTPRSESKQAWEGGATAGLGDRLPDWFAGRSPWGGTAGAPCGTVPTQDSDLPSVPRTLQHVEEKEFDVSLAVQLVEDAAGGVFDQALIVSGDSDMAPAVHAVRRLRPDARLVALFPPRRSSHQLEVLADATLRIFTGPQSGTSCRTPWSQATGVSHAPPTGAKRAWPLGNAVPVNARPQ